jgi:DNA-binding GntR family transcriptional regulator
MTIAQPNSAGLEPLMQPTLVDSAAAAIRSAILSGRIRPGERLVEAELARELHISRGPIREALAQLSKDGLVTNVPRHGKFVQDLSPRLVDELYSLRRVIEPYAVTRVIERLDADAKARLEGALADIAAAVEAQDEQRLAHQDLAFHELLYTLADHDLLKRAWLENIAGKLHILLNVTTKTLPGLYDAERQHRRILNPIVKGDAVAARASLEQHIDEAHERARRSLWKDGEPLDESGAQAPT